MKSTSMANGKNRLLAIIVVYLAIWSISLVSFWLFSKGDALGHSIIFLYIVLPVTTFIVSFLIGKNNECGKWKWLFAIAFGIMYMLADYTTFRTANMIAFGKINMPQFGLVPVGTVISFIGMGIGYGVRWMNSRKKKQSNTKTRLKALKDFRG